MKLVEQHGTDAGQFGSSCRRRSSTPSVMNSIFVFGPVIFEPRLIAHTLAKCGVAFPGDAASEERRRRAGAA